MVLESFFVEKNAFSLKITFYVLKIQRILQTHDRPPMAVASTVQGGKPLHVGLFNVESLKFRGPLLDVSLCIV